MGQRGMKPEKPEICVFAVAFAPFAGAFEKASSEALRALGHTVRAAHAVIALARVEARMAAVPVARQRRARCAEASDLPLLRRVRVFAPLLDRIAPDVCVTPRAIRVVQRLGRRLVVVRHGRRAVVWLAHTGAQRQRRQKFALTWTLTPLADGR
eukprot:4720421-Prymnesium_polylepis.2